ncbi:MAG TPA: translation initiation factor IF-2 [Candidatus Paceibacterota bacterium]
MKKEKDKPKESFTRHPVVVVLGHVDHGKTTLLDYIRKTNVALRESGGITQHIGAYEIAWNDKKITFLDTPGHETFSKMRERGAHVADIAILVVAADEGVKPQTVEAYSAIKKAEIPFVVALNKIDRNTSDPDRVKSGLAEIGVLVEGWGGNTPCVPVSAKTGEHVAELLDTMLLLAELEALTGDPAMLAEGVVIEAHLDSRRGPSATLLITNGSLKKGLFILAGSAFAPVRILENTLGKPIDEAGPSSPVHVAGFNEIPPVGAAFFTYASKKELEEVLSRVVTTKGKSEETPTDIGVLIKTDVAGSLEALEDQARTIVPDGLKVKFFEGGAGDVTETDVQIISSAKKGIIIAFRTKLKPGVADLAARFGVAINSFEIIYEATDWLRDTFKELQPKKFVRTDVGKLVVLKIFRSASGGRVIGGRVKEGKAPKDAQFEIVREDSLVGKGSVQNIERNKITVDALREGEEGGLLVSSSKAIEERDVLMFFYEEESRTK